LLAELDEPFLDLVKLLAFLEGGEILQASKLASDDSVDAQDFPEKRDPVRLGFIELAGSLQNGLVLFR
jgi:hypothetical protein